MVALFENVEFWKALSALLWPIFALIVFLSARTKIYAFLNRENLSIKVAGMEISVADATKNLGSSVSDLQKRLAEIEGRLGRSAGGTESSSPPTGVQTSPAQPKAAFAPNLSHPFSILWIDDYPSNNAFLIDQFQKDGIEVKLALSTAEGLKDFSSTHYDMVITDLGRQEHGIDHPFAGLDLIKQIRALDTNIPILVYAGQRGLQNQSKLTKAGATKVTQSAVEVQSFINGIRQRTQLGTDKLTS